MGYNKNDGSIALLNSTLLHFLPQFGPYKTASDYVDPSIFDGFAQHLIPEAENPLVLSYIRRQYHRNNVAGLIDLVTDIQHRCDILKTSAKFLYSGRKVFTYRFDQSLYFARRSYPYLGASHTFDLHVLFGRPWIKPNLYSEEERTLFGRMVSVWSVFVGGEEGPSTPDGEVIVISGNHALKHETEDLTKCEFLDCLPELLRIAKGQKQKDSKCAVWVRGMSDNGKDGGGGARGGRMSIGGDGGNMYGGGDGDSSNGQGKGLVIEKNEFDWTYKEQEDETGGGVWTVATSFVLVVSVLNTLVLPV